MRLETEDLSQDLLRLEARLAALPPDCDAMQLSELDGFLTGIIVSPEAIPPSEWLPVIWGGDSEPAFASKNDLEEFFGLVLNHYNSIASGLMDDGEGCQPIFDVDNDEVLWETWITGFETAMALRRDSWAAILDSDDDEGASALSIMAALAMIAGGAPSEDLEGVKVDEVAEAAPEIIPGCVETLAAWRLAHHEIAGPVVRTKVGRNEPCPCGSGKKYKKCCGAN